ncbi:MAG: aldose 1-epimerase family protein, partial [Lactobacillaceae bacterium]|nr:aldose 1-epimerase family protein [Lactobacillaceae bacterium]
ILEKNEYKYTFNLLGAELTSIKKGEKEFIWQGNPLIWKRHAPILFPIVGKLKNDQYELNGKTFLMKQHGFARDLNFSLKEKTSDKISFLLSSNTLTKEQYPYDFNFYVNYYILDDGLKIEFITENKSNETMYYSVGWHPGFNSEKTILSFENKKNNYYQLKNHLVDNEQISGFFKKEEILNSKDFENDAFIFENLNSSVILNNQIKLSNDSPYLGIWSQYPKTGNFVAIEPWWGLADTINSNYNFKEKTGIMQIPINKSDTHCTYLTFLNNQ